MEKLVNIAYNELPAEHQSGLMSDTFCSMLGRMPLQWPSWLSKTKTLKNAVRAGNEFIQIRPCGEQGASTCVKQIKEDEEEVVSNPTEKMLTTLVQVMQQRVEKVKQLKVRPTGQPLERWIRPRTENGNAGSVERLKIAEGIVSVRQHLPLRVPQIRETDRARNSSAYY